MHRTVYAIFFLVALLCPALSFAQAIELRPLDNLPAETNFNPAYIIANKIKTITISIANKPDNQVIDDKGLVQHYTFDTLGRVTESYYTIISGHQHVK